MSGFQIIDGMGSGQLAQVKNNKLLVSAVVSTREHYSNHNLGQGYSVTFNDTTPTSGDCFFYLKNTNNDMSISIEGFLVHLEVDDYFDIRINNTGTPADGNELTPVNLNTASGNIADCICQYGTNITGLTAGDTVMRYYLGASSESRYYNFDQDIVLGSNGVFTMWMGETAAEISVSVSFNFHGEGN